MHVFWRVPAPARSIWAPPLWWQLEYASRLAEGSSVRLTQHLMEYSTINPINPLFLRVSAPGRTPVHRYRLVRAQGRRKNSKTLSMRQGLKVDVIHVEPLIRALSQETGLAIINHRPR